MEQIAGLIEKHISRTQANSVRKSIPASIVPVVEPDIVLRISEIEILPEYSEEH